MHSAKWKAEKTPRVTTEPPGAPGSIGLVGARLEKWGPIRASRWPRPKRSFDGGCDWPNYAFLAVPSKGAPLRRLPRRCVWGSQRRTGVKDPKKIRLAAGEAGGAALPGPSNCHTASICHRTSWRPSVSRPPGGEPVAPAPACWDVPPVGVVPGNSPVACCPLTTALDICPAQKESLALSP